jgi:predicted lysophospholipase L1 biosynthesis ABC-type transport system permease subunit
VFDERDDERAPPVVIVSDSLARKYWPAGDPLNERLLIGRGMGPQFVEQPRQIVGIVSDVRESLGSDIGPTVYVPTSQVSDGFTLLLNQRTPMGWVIRTTVAPHQVAAAVQRELRQTSGGLAISAIRTMDELSRESTARERFNMLLLTIFGGAALVLAVVGVYGLMAYSVQQRQQEMGIRLALGADARQLRNLVVGQGMTVALIGVAVGIGGAFALTKILSGFLFGVTTHDPVTFVIVPAVLAVVSFVGAWLPARRAGRVDPISALRGA